MILKWYRNRILDGFLKGRKAYEDEDHRKRVHRIKIIQGICNKNMATAETSNGLPIKTHVVVPYDDLLRIWDNADRITYSE